MLPIVRRSRVQLGLGILIAIALATLSLLHQHALIPDELSPAPCHICAFGADVTVSAPEIVAPAQVAYLLPADSAPELANCAIVAVPARAPPAA